ncbi:MAG: ubiquitin-conjugating enzyme E2 [Lacipirellulaceae bacterium]
MSNVRLRRLTADHEKLREYVRLHPRVRLIQADGTPPERYQLEYRIKSVRMRDGELQETLSHMVEIHLPRNYPRTPPQCRMLSPVFHPNIAPHAICVGDHWGSGEPLQSIVTRIGEMIAYQSYNVKSPLNGEAARWVEDNKDRLPLDPVSLLPEEGTSEVTAASKQSDAPPTPAAKTFPSEPPGDVEATPKLLSIACPHCQASYRVKEKFHGRKLRCKKCREVFTVEAE